MSISDQPDLPGQASWIEQIAAVAETAHLSGNRLAAEIIANLLYDIIDQRQARNDLHQQVRAPNARPLMLMESKWG